MFFSNGRRFIFLFRGVGTIAFMSLPIIHLGGMGPSRQQVALVALDIGSIVVGLIYAVDGLLLSLFYWELSCLQPRLMTAALIPRPLFHG